MQSLQAQQIFSQDWDSLYQLELKDYKRLRREDTILFWVWLLLLVVTAVVVLGGAIGLLTGLLIIINQVTEVLIIALVGVATGACAGRFALRRKDISKKKGYF